MAHLETRLGDVWQSCTLSLQQQLSCVCSQLQSNLIDVRACARGFRGIAVNLRVNSVQVESQITFLKADQAPVVKRLDEVLVEAALLEANFGAAPQTETLPPKAIAALLPDKHHKK